MSWFTRNYEALAAPFVLPPDPVEGPVCNFCGDQVLDPVCPCLPTDEPAEDQGEYDDIREALMEDAS